MIMFSACGNRRSRLEISALLNFALVGITFSAMQLITHESTAVNCGHVTSLMMANLVIRLYMTPCIAVAAALSSVCAEYVEYIDIYTVFSLLIHESITASLLISTPKCARAPDITPLSTILFGVVLTDVVRVALFALIMCKRTGNHDNNQEDEEQSTPLIERN